MGRSTGPERERIENLLILSGSVRLARRAQAAEASGDRSRRGCLLKAEKTHTTTRRSRTAREESIECRN